MPLPGMTLQADASYYQSDSPSDHPPGPDAAAVTMPGPENGPAQDVQLPDTQVFTLPPNIACARSQSTLELPETVATLVLPPQTRCRSPARKQITGHFVPVSPEELGKTEIEEPKPAIISLQTCAWLPDCCWWASPSGILPQAAYRRFAYKRIAATH